MALERNTKAVWESHRSTLWDLWKQQDMPTAKIIKHMKEQHSFIANKNAYDRQFQRWGWRKKLTQAEWRLIGRHAQRRRLLGKESEFRLNEAAISWKHRMKRYDTGDIQTVDSPDNDLPPLPAQVTVSTPRPNSPIVSSDSPPQPAQLTMSSSIPTRPTVLDLKSLPYSSFLARAEGIFRELPISEPELWALSRISAIRRKDVAKVNIDLDFLGLGQVLPPSLQVLQSLLYIVSNNLPICSVPFNLKYVLSPAQGDSGTDIARALSSIPSPVVEASFAAILSDAVSTDDVTLVRTLLAQVDASQSLSAGASKVILLVDEVNSVAMMQLLCEAGLDLGQATSPFLRHFLNDEDNDFYGEMEDFETLDHNELVHMYRMLVTARHPATAESLPYIVRTGEVSLVRQAIKQSVLSQEQLGAAAIWCFDSDIAADEQDRKEIQSLLLSLLDPGWEHSTRFSLVAAAARHRLPTALQYLISAGAPLNRPLETLDSAFYSEACGTKSRGSSGTALQYALIWGDMLTAEELLIAGADPEGDMSSDFPSPLQLAVLREETDFCETLLEYGASPDGGLALDWREFRRRQGIFWAAISDQLDVSSCAHTPLGLAVSSGDHSIVDALIAAGADVNPKVRYDKEEHETPLSAAVEKSDTALVSLLLKAGAKLTGAYEGDNEHINGNVRGCSALVTAIMHGDEHILNVLKPYVRTHIDINCLDKRRLVNHYRDSNTTPLTAALDHRAVRLNHTKGCRHHALAHELIYKYGAMVRDSGVELCPLTVAVASDCDECVLMILDAGAPVTNDVLCRAISTGLGRIKQLIHHHLCYDDIRGNDEHNQAQVQWLSHESARMIANCLLNIESRRSWPTETCSSEASQYLSELRIDWKADCMRELLFNITNRSYGDNTENRKKIRWLIDQGVSPECFDSGSSFTCCNRAIPSGKSVLEFAIDSEDPDLTGYLLDRGADSDNVRTYKVLRTNNRPECKVLTETTPLREAAKKGNEELAAMLIERGADVRRPATKILSRTALQTAAENGHRSFCRFLINQHGVDVNEAPAKHSGVTTLQAAAIRGDLVFAHELLVASKPANVNAPGARINGRTALEGAAENGRLDMASLLLLAGADIGDSAFGQVQYRNSVRFARANGFHAVAKVIEEARAKKLEAAGDIQQRDNGQVIVIDE